MSRDGSEEDEMKGRKEEEITRKQAMKRGWKRKSTEEREWGNFKEKGTKNEERARNREDIQRTSTKLRLRYNKNYHENPNVKSREIKEI